MELRGIMKWSYEVMEFITRVVYVQFLWIISLIPGLLLFGIAPATVAAYKVAANWATGKGDLSILKTFFSQYKNNFIRSNILFLPLLAISNVLYINFRYAMQIDGLLFYGIIVASTVALALLILTILYALPLYVLKELPLKNYYKTALLLSFHRPIHTFAMVLVAYTIYQLIMLIPGLLPILPIGLFIFISSKIASDAISRSDTTKKNAGILKEEIA
ncbi:DUF624 domain-containing protein [Paenalkalicoccus suaedae]|uniref:DUF624 domain-containing protein n=1 Tax=Paenalkalicoccus suaedae TaxID=2592382 RepID=A0A859FJK5_9BACI|nr:DUF624 domain-containing protein [Paenalkalicoccus suaedae]QKS72966.1 DUF624 domain-containing protein [Paenalkalicoccus suaedae]